jgi:Glycosyl hydrolases family 11
MLRNHGRAKRRWLGTYDPSSKAQSEGEVAIDGSLYNIAQSTLVDRPSPDGTQTFQQFWSVRKDKRSSGTIDIGAHFRAWSDAGLRLGVSHYYQVMACGGYPDSAGYFNITVVDIPGITSTTTPTSTPYEPPGSTCCHPPTLTSKPTTVTTTAQPTTTSLTTSTTTSAPPEISCALLWEQCGGDGWNGFPCCKARECLWLNDQCVENPSFACNELTGMLKACTVRVKEHGIRHESNALCRTYSCRSSLFCSCFATYNEIQLSKTCILLDFKGARFCKMVVAWYTLYPQAGHS